MKDLRIENEKQYAYLKTVIDHLDTAIIVFNRNGDIELCNQSLLNLFQKTSIKNIAQLDSFYANFSGILLDLLPKIPKLFTVQVNNEKHFLSVRGSIFKLDTQEMRLVSFQVINEEMNETEMRSWEKLIRVLTHEIMNSVSPITSLTTTLKRIFKKSDQKVTLEDIKDSDIDDTISGLEIINDRSQGLLNFIKKYREVHLMPKPVFEEFELKSILDRIGKLFKNDLEKNKISFQVEVYPKNIKVSADKAMLEQVLINLIKNSIESFKDNKEKNIEIKAYKNVSDNIIIEIIDNGEGIANDIKDDIFVPFFSTKKTGSGIGLSLVKQFVILNNAKLSFKSEPYKETIFAITFRN
ncbi:MAG: ATP-binding protein [Marinilabiliales bacterium]|nr:MAG: ATP-binding protein [Marinilabiliales bacterium]